MCTLELDYSLNRAPIFGQGKHEQKLTLNCDLIAESGVLKGADKI